MLFRSDDEFVCFTDPSTPIVKKFFKKIDATAQLTRLTEALQQILASDPEILDVAPHCNQPDQRSD